MAVVSSSLLAFSSLTNRVLSSLSFQFFEESGKRVFDVDVEGTVETGVDIFDRAGGKLMPYVLETIVDVSDSSLSMDFTATVNSASTYHDGRVLMCNEVVNQFLIFVFSFSHFSTLYLFNRIIWYRNRYALIDLFIFFV